LTPSRLPIGDAVAEVGSPLPDGALGRFDVCSVGRDIVVVLVVYSDSVVVVEVVCDGS